MRFLLFNLFTNFIFHNNVSSFRYAYAVAVNLPPGYLSNKFNMFLLLCFSRSIISPWQQWCGCSHGTTSLRASGFPLLCCWLCVSTRPSSWSKSDTRIHTFQTYTPPTTSSSFRQERTFPKRTSICLREKSVCFYHLCQGSATPGTRASIGTRHRNQWHTRNKCNKCAKYLNCIFGS